MISYLYIKRYNQNICTNKSKINNMLFTMSSSETNCHLQLGSKTEVDINSGFIRCFKVVVDPHEFLYWNFSLNYQAFNVFWSLWTPKRNTFVSRCVKMFSSSGLIETFLSDLLVHLWSLFIWSILSYEGFHLRLIPGKFLWNEFVEWIAGLNGAIDFLHW